MCPVDFRKESYFVSRWKAVPSDAQDSTPRHEVDELIRRVVIDARASVEWLDCGAMFDEKVARCLAAAILEAPYDGVYYDLGVRLDIGERHESMAVAVAATILEGCCSDEVRRNALEVLGRCPRHQVIGREMFGHNFASTCSPLED